MYEKLVATRERTIFYEKALKVLKNKQFCSKSGIQGRQPPCCYAHASVATTTYDKKPLEKQH